ncbi:XRE family transcriptional regulator [Sphingomonas koreensis]|nr:XRE family transcriptional regulator [Sphingomonas koreensis]
MSAARNSLFPRSAIPMKIGAAVRSERRKLGWSQERLAQKAGVTRWTIIRLERPEGLKHLPTSHLVHALQTALDMPQLVIGWTEAASPMTASYGPRCHRARRAAGISQQEVAEAADISAATLSRFERELCFPLGILRETASGDYVLHNVAFAHALGFDGLDALEIYCSQREG